MSPRLWPCLVAAPAAAPAARGRAHGRPAVVRPAREREKREGRREKRGRGEGILREMDLGFDIRDDEDEKRDGEIFIS